MNERLTFTYEKVKYTADSASLNKLDRVVLPDGELLEVQGWYKGQPISFLPISHNIHASEVKTIAERTNAVIASRAIKNCEVKYRGKTFTVETKSSGSLIVKPLIHPSTENNINKAADVLAITPQMLETVLIAIIEKMSS